MEPGSSSIGFSSESARVEASCISKSNIAFIFAPERGHREL